MARRTDSGWRDTLLAERHRLNGFEAPAAGMTLPMIEYDRGKAVGIVSYGPVGSEKPRGPEVGAAYRAFGRLGDLGAWDTLPFLTARYDAATWSFELFPHNDAAQALLGQQSVAPHWSKVTERTFAEVLYRMRGRELPDLSPYGVRWLDDFRPHTMTLPAAEFEKWPGQNLSTRRRNWEPAVSVPFSQRVPCLDIDFAVVGRDEHVAALVDYKAYGAKADLKHANYKALASLTTFGSIAVNVAAFVAEYAPVKPAWEFRVHCLNQSARLLLAYALGATDASTPALASTVTGGEWIFLTEPEWYNVLRCARDM
jgi:hypothetical protein